MNKFVFIFAILAIAQCQELVVQDWTGAYTTGTEFSKVYQKPDWNNYVDFAIYGWMKISSAYPRADWSTVFHFTHNPDNIFANASINGDRSLSFFIINNSFVTPTYTTSSPNVHEYYTFVADDLDKWAFFYVAYGSQQQRKLTYVKFATTTINNPINGIVHVPAPYYKIMVGHSVQYKYFQGSLSRVTIQAGPGAYRESNFEQIQAFNPTAIPTCPVLYSGCAFTGQSQNVCSNIPSYKVNDVKSVYIPTGYTVTLFDQDNYAGKTVKYNQSIECISAHNWNFLVESGAITVTESKVSKKIKRNSH